MSITFDNLIESLKGLITTHDEDTSAHPTKQDLLVSRVNIKEINEIPVLGSGNIDLLTEHFFIDDDGYLNVTSTSGREDNFSINSDGYLVYEESG